MDSGNCIRNKATRHTEKYVNCKLLLGLRIMFGNNATKGSSHNTNIHANYVKEYMKIFKS